MRTTVKISAALVRDARKLAAERGVTLKALVEVALRRELGRRAAARRLRRLPLFTADGLTPGVELHDTSKLLELVGE